MNIMIHIGSSHSIRLRPSDLLRGLLRLTVEQLLQQLLLDAISLIFINSAHLQIELCVNGAMIRKDCLSSAITLEVQSPLALVRSLIQDAITPRGDAALLRGIINVLPVVVFVGRVKVQRPLFESV
jgi:hypothetical protein